MLSILYITLSFTALVSSVPHTSRIFSRASDVKSTTCNGQTYVYEELAGYGFAPSNGRDKYGDTLGGIGSSIAIDSSTWRKEGESYKGTVYALPDRGW